VDPNAVEPMVAITVHHSAYYDWQPRLESDVQDGDVVVDAPYPGFKMVRVLKEEPNTTVTSVHIPSLDRIDNHRVEAGVGKRGRRANLIRHLEDGAWYKHFPEGSITDITATDPKFEKWLREHFLSEEGD
jgi:hypothetical protein